MKKLTDILEFVKTGKIKEEYVNLELPSGNLWATCNIGAKEPYEYGEYFQWGGTENRSDKKCDGTTNVEWNNTPEQLPSENDVVYQRSHGKARMPTKEDIEELLQNTKQTWCAYSDVDPESNKNIHGVLFTGNNDKSIFIPACGLKYKFEIDRAGAFGYIWSASIDKAYNPAAAALIMSKFGNQVETFSRVFGFTVRGVKSK